MNSKTNLDVQEIYGEKSLKSNGRRNRSRQAAPADHASGLTPVRGKREGLGRKTYRLQSR